MGIGNKYIALILLFLISVKTLIVPAVYLDFEFRKDYIIKNLCENRFKPQLKCNGACYLAQKLNKLAEDKATNETNNHSHSIKKVMEEVYDVKEYLVFSLFEKIESTATNSFCNILLPNGSNLLIFHPPIV
jgi:hypothetical protein